MLTGTVLDAQFDEFIENETYYFRFVTFRYIDGNFRCINLEFWVWRCGTLYWDSTYVGCLVWDVCSSERNKVSN